MTSSQEGITGYHRPVGPPYQGPNRNVTSNVFIERVFSDRMQGNSFDDVNLLQTQWTNITGLLCVYGPADEAAEVLTVCRCLEKYLKCSRVLKM